MVSVRQHIKNISTKLSSLVNLVAKGYYDCSHYADGSSTGGIQEALDLATQKPVYIPAGTHDIQAKIIPPDKSCIFSHGHESILKLDDNINGDVFELPKNCSEIELRNFCIDGNKANNMAGRGIYAPDGVFRSKIQNLKVINTFDDGIYLLEGTGSLNNNYIIKNFISNNGDSGIYLSESKDNIVAGNLIYQSDSFGIRIANGDRNHIIKNICYDGGTSGMFINGPCSTHVIGNILSYNTGHGFYIEAGGTVFLTNNTSALNAVHGCYINATHNIFLLNNYFYANGNTYDDLRLNGSYDCFIAFNHFTGLPGYSEYGIHLTATTYNNYLFMNHSHNHDTGEILDLGANNIFRSKFYRVQNPDSPPISGYGVGLACSDGSDVSCKMMCFIPDDFQELLGFYAVFIGESSPNGVLRYQIDTKFGKLDRAAEENYDTHSDSHALSSHTCDEKKLELIDIADCLTDVNYNDLIEAKFTFKGTDGANTVTGNFIGYYLRYR